MFTCFSLFGAVSACEWKTENAVDEVILDFTAYESCASFETFQRDVNPFLTSPLCFSCHGSQPQFPLSSDLTNANYARALAQLNPPSDLNILGYPLYTKARGDDHPVAALNSGSAEEELLLLWMVEEQENPCTLREDLAE